MIAFWLMVACACCFCGMWLGAEIELRNERTRRHMLLSDLNNGETF